jgi:geranylgeranylglycerol-phosphate geranylgeranyltransferase
MIFSGTFCFFLWITSGLGFSRSVIVDQKTLVSRQRMFEETDFDGFAISKIKQKTKGIVKLIRPTNLIPASLLCLTSGFIMKPRLMDLLKSNPFYISIAVTLIVMSNSMVLNDLFDIELDKMNNPDRPLVNGQITRREALGLSTLLFIISEALSTRYLNIAAQKVVHIANVGIFLYTPVFKRIPFVKNIVCSGIIAFSTFFTGMAIGIGSNSSNELLTVLFKTIFFGSLNVEILMDIVDMDGDKKNGVLTVPILYGPEFAWNLAHNICFFSILTTSFSMAFLYDITAAVYFLLLQMPMFLDMAYIHTCRYNSDIIRKYSQRTFQPLVFTLAYLCLVARFK